MPDDILDAAQKAINDAATGAKPANAAAPAPSIPVEPPPTPATAEPTPAVQQAPKQDETPASPLPPPPPQDPSLDATKQAMMNELLGSSTVAPVVQPSQSTPPPQHSNGNFAQKKKPRPGIILAVIALLLLTVPIAVYFVSQSGPIAELRGKAAWDTVYQGCTLNSCPSGYTCHCQNGNACTYTWCEAGIEESCRAQGREYCTNGYNGNAKTCCYPGYHCGTAQNPGCFRDGGDDNGDDDTVQPTATPPTVVPVCQNIKIYKGTAQVTPSTLLPGDVVTLAVKGNLTPTKARFRINGGAWQETTTKNASNEFTLSYTIPDGVPDFVIEGEVFTNGAWH